jgi:predicted nucleic acid-binding protein
VRELRKERVKICTSILTVQEVSVLCYRSGGAQVDNYAKVERMTDRIYGVNREIVLIAAQLEAQILDRAKSVAN